MFTIFDLLIINSKMYLPLIESLLIQVRVERKEPYKCGHSTINQQKIKSVVDERARLVCYDILYCTLYPSFERFEDEYNVFVYSISTTYFLKLHYLQQELSRFHPGKLFLVLFYKGEDLKYFLSCILTIR